MQKEAALSLAKLEAAGKITSIERKLSPDKLSYLQGRYDEGRVTDGDFAEVGVWLSRDDYFPVYAPANEEWSWRLPEGGQMVGLGWKVQTLLERHMKAGRDLAAWWDHLNKPETRPPNWQVSKPSPMRLHMSSLATSLLDGTPQPLDDGWEGLDPSPTSLDLP